MEILFDCSQFLICHGRGLSGELSLESIAKELKRIWGSDVIIAKEIIEKKLMYINELLSASGEVIIELPNKEFIGEFEDWQDPSRFPMGLKKIELCIDFCFSAGFNKVTIVIVSSAAKEFSKIYTTECERTNLIEKLFIKSLHYFGLGAYSDVLIIHCNL